MGLCYELCSANQLASLASCMAKTVMLDITCKLFKFLSYLPCLGTIDFYYLIPLSLSMTLPGGRRISTKVNLLASFSRSLFV